MKDNKSSNFDNPYYEGIKEDCKYHVKRKLGF